MLLAAAFWVSFFALYWLMLLGLAVADAKHIVALVFFFLGACFITMSIHGASLGTKR